jgi:hypothetical protein
VRSVLKANKEEFIEHVRQLGVSTLSAIDIHRALQANVERMDNALEGIYGRDSVTSVEGLAAMTRHVSSLCPGEMQEGYCLTESAAAALLESHPPVNMIGALGYRSTAELLDREGPVPALSLTRATEEPDWQARYKHLLARRTADDFEARPIQFLPIDSTRYQRAFRNSKQPRKLWRATHNKEAGVVACLTQDPGMSLRTPLLQYALVSMHYFFEAAYASKHYALVAKRDPEGLGRAVVDTIDSHREKLTFFYSNVYSENLFWERALALFGEAFPGREIDWFRAASARGEYCLSTGVQNIVVSLNLVDHLWNMNFLGHAGMESFQHDAIYFLYHFRGALWQEVFSRLTKAAGTDMERLIVENLGVGDATLTERLLGDLRQRPAYAESGVRQ